MTPNPAVDCCRESGWHRPHFRWLQAAWTEAARLPLQPHSDNQPCPHRDHRGDAGDLDGHLPRAGDAAAGVGLPPQSLAFASNQLRLALWKIRCSQPSSYHLREGLDVGSQRTLLQQLPTEILNSGLFHSTLSKLDVAVVAVAHQMPHCWFCSLRSVDGPSHNIVWRAVFTLRPHPTLTTTNARTHSSSVRGAVAGCCLPSGPFPRGSSSRRRSPTGLCRPGLPAVGCSGMHLLLVNLSPNPQVRFAFG